MSDGRSEVRFCPSLPSERVLCSSAVLFPGVYDQLGCALVIFPAEFQYKLLCDVSKEEVAEFVFYCLRLHSKSRCLVSVVADLREASLAVTRRIAEILLLLQLHKCTVLSLYAILPKKRDVQKLLQKLLSPSKRSPSLVKCLFLREVFELYNYVDRSQLTANLGGYFIYSHESWVSFIKEMDSFVQEFMAVVRKLPVCISTLQDFSKLSVPAEFDSLAVFCSANQARLDHLRRDLGLDALLRRCECMLEKFRYPERDACYQAMVGTVLFTHTTLEMLQNYDRIRAAVEKVDLLWRRVFSNTHLRLHTFQLQRDAHQVGCEMERVLQKMRSYTPETLRDSDRAETLRLEFNASVNAQAVVLVRRAEDVLNGVSETEGREKHEWVNELQRQTDQLREAMEFQNRNLNTICTFHHCYHKMQRWYHAAVCESFLQDLLWRTCSGKHGGEETLLSHKQSKVFSVIEEFLRLHPLPEEDELMQLEHLANIVHDAHLEHAGKQLAQRCACLRKVLMSPGSSTFRDLQPAVQWQYEYLKGRNETAVSISDLHTWEDVCAEENVLKDSKFFTHSVHSNGFARQDGPSYSLHRQSEAKPPSLSSFDSGFDGAGSGHLDTGGGKTCQDKAPKLKSPHVHFSEENVSSISEGLAEGKPLRAPTIHIIPSVSGDSVNFEITVKRSATLPKNPWLSLPVDDLENCYTVIISPTQQRATSSCDQLTQTINASVCDFEDHECSPIHNVLSSTITDGGLEVETSQNVPSLVWDSYDLRDLMHDSDSMVLGEPKCEWEINEQRELRAVEEMLNRADNILQEEESILAQEEILDVLLEADNPDRLWPSWNQDFTQMTSSDLAEAGVIGLEDNLDSLHFGLDNVLSQESARVIQSGSDQLNFERGNGGLDRSELFKELKNLKVLEEKIVEENLKICELRESEEKMSTQSLSEDRSRFLKKLEEEKKEVEKMERNLSREMKKSKPKCLSSSRKIVTCSIMGKTSVLEKDDEALLINCRKPAQEILNRGQPCLEEPINQQPADSPAHHQCLDPEASINSKCSNVAADSLTSDCVNPQLNSEDQQNTDCTASPLSLALHSHMAEGGCDTETKVSDLVSVIEGHTFREPDKVEENQMHLDPSETLDTSEQCNEDRKMETFTSEEISSPAFDPGGPTPFPQTFGLNKQMCIDSKDNASNAINQAVVSTAFVASVDPKELENPPCRTSPIELKSQNTNNNNLHALDLCVGLEKGSKEHVRSEGINRAEDQKSGEWCDAPISRTLLSLVETLKPCEAVEHKEGEVRCSDSFLTRSVCKSSVLEQLQICTREMSYFQTPVVLDTGSSLVKAGFADQDLPTTIFPTAIGLPKYEEVMSGSVERSVYVGHDAQHMRGVLTLHYPMRNGVVSSWDQMEMIWSHAFEQLRVCSEDHPVLLTEGAMSTHENRQHSVQIMFESFNVPLAYVAMQPVLALYTTGRTTGVVFDSGDGASHSVPVYDGYCFPHAVQRFNLAGADVTLHLKQLLTEQGVCMRTSAEMEIVREIKERCCCVTLNYEAEFRGGGGASAPVHYTLPDGQVVTLTMERFRAPEILFRPDLIGQDYYGMQDSIFKSVLQSDIDLRRDLLGNIVLSGGNTLLPGLPERLQCEISRLAPVGLGEMVKVTSPKDRDFSVWRGGAILAGMPSFSSAWISQDEYEEFGPQIVFRKCF